MTFEIKNVVLRVFINSLYEVLQLACTIPRGSLWKRQLNKPNALTIILTMRLVYYIGLMDASPVLLM